MRRKVLVLAIAVVICIPIVGHTQDMDTAGSVITVEAKLATGIQDREPVGVGSTFPADVDTVYLWTRVMGAKDTTFIKCVWTYGDEEMASVELPVRSPSWRTWSSKAIMPKWTGKWDVKVVDADGNVLKGLTFTIEPTSEMTSSEKMGEMKGKATGAMESAKDTASKAMESMKNEAMMKKDSVMKDTTKIKEPGGN